MHVALMVSAHPERAFSESELDGGREKEVVGLLAADCVVSMLLRACGSRGGIEFNRRSCGRLSGVPDALEQGVVDRLRTGVCCSRPRLTKRCEVLE